MPNAGTSALSRHGDEAGLVANDRLHIAGDNLRDEVGVEERLRNPCGAVVGLVDELEQRALALVLRSGILRIPAVDEVTNVRCERRA